MPNNVFDIITSSAVAAYWGKAYNPETSIPHILFPVKKKLGIELKWIKGSKGLAPSLAPAAFDTKGVLRTREGIKVTATQMPFFKDGVRFSEVDLITLNIVKEANNPLAEDILRNYYDDAADRINGADVVYRRMVYQLLFPADGKPKITFNANGANYSYDYDPNGTWTSGNYVTLTGTSLWSASATAKPLTDIRGMGKKLLNDHGSKVKYLLMNSNTFAYIGDTTEVKNRFVMSNGNSAGMLLDDEVKRVIKSATGYDVVIDDSIYADEDGVRHAYIPDGYVAFIPDGNLGTMYRGTTPEETDLMGGNDVDVSIVDNGIAIKSYKSNDPANTFTFVSQIILPSYERMDEVGLLKVIA